MRISGLVTVSFQLKTFELEIDSSLLRGIDLMQCANRSLDFNEKYAAVTSFSSTVDILTLKSDQLNLILNQWLSHENGINGGGGSGPCGIVEPDSWCDTGSFPPRIWRLPIRQTVNYYSAELACENLNSPDRPSNLGRWRLPSRQELAEACYRLKSGLSAWLQSMPANFNQHGQYIYTNDGTSSDRHWFSGFSLGECVNGSLMGSYSDASALCVRSTGP